MANCMSNMKRVNLYGVGMKHKQTDEKITLQVWASNNDEATHQCNFLFDYDGEYRWTGTGPIYKDNQIVSKMVKL